MRELSDDSATRRRQLELFAKIDKRKNLIGTLYQGNFRSDPDLIIRETVQTLRNELREWEDML